MPHDKRALGPPWNDDHILEVLRGHQAQNFRSKVEKTVRPANAATGYGAAPKVQTIHFGMVYVDFPVRSRLRDAVNFRRVEFQDQPKVPVRGSLVKICSGCSFYQIVKGF